jgi:dipeptidyl aminopeptidase/acylaminoacyl peptidase
MAMDDVYKRADAVQDVEYAARWLKSRPEVDASKLVIYGGSYGGFMVLASLSTYPDTWAAGIDVVGIANFVSFLENTGAYRRALREAEYGSLATDREFLTQISPLTQVDKIKAPLFIIQGANDPRVPKSEADQIANALRDRGRVVEYLLFDDEGHGLRKTRNRILGYSAAVEFLEKHVLNK